VNSDLDAFWLSMIFLPYSINLAVSGILIRQSSYASPCYTSSADLHRTGSMGMGDNATTSSLIKAPLQFTTTPVTKGSILGLHAPRLYKILWTYARSHRSEFLEAHRALLPGTFQHDTRDLEQDEIDECRLSTTGPVKLAGRGVILVRPMYSGAH
jgi:hypothetical protein